MSDRLKDFFLRMISSETLENVQPSRHPDGELRQHDTPTSKSSRVYKRDRVVPNVQLHLRDSER